MALASVFAYSEVTAPGAGTTLAAIQGALIPSYPAGLNRGDFIKFHAIAYLSGSAVAADNDNIGIYVGIPGVSQVLVATMLIVGAPSIIPITLDYIYQIPSTGVALLMGGSVFMSNPAASAAVYHTSLVLTKLDTDRLTII